MMIMEDVGKDEHRINLKIVYVYGIRNYIIVTQSFIFAATLHPVR